MTYMPQYKICSKCKRRYSWNPDVGNLCCPYCHKDKKLKLLLPFAGKSLRKKD